MITVDSHTHWGPSITLGINVSKEEILSQADEAGVDRIVIFPFPSAAIENEGINNEVLNLASKEKRFIPYYYIPDDLKPIPKDKGFFGGKWHWVRGIQDAKSNYKVLEDPALLDFIKVMEELDLPIVFEEELEFTRLFVKKTRKLKIIVPHMGMLGGDPLDFLDSFWKSENVFFDTSLSSPAIIEKFIRKIGPSRVIFGSDLPFGRMENELNKILTLPISDDAKDKILGKNILDLICLSP